MPPTARKTRTAAIAACREQRSPCGVMSCLPLESGLRQHLVVRLRPVCGAFLHTSDGLLGRPRGLVSLDCQIRENKPYRNPPGPRSVALHPRGRAERSPCGGSRACRLPGGWIRSGLPSVNPFLDMGEAAASLTIILGDRIDLNQDGMVEWFVRFFRAVTGRPRR